MFLDNILRYLRWQKVIKVIKRFPKKPIVCDVGSGTNGEFLKKISNFIELGFGFDKKANFYKNSKVELRKIDLEKENIPLRKETIDIVSIAAVLEHFKNPDCILREIFRILKPNGFLILTTPDLKAKSILKFITILKLTNKEDILEHKTYYSLKELKNLLLKSGFKEENINLKYFEFGFNILAIVKK